MRLVHKADLSVNMNEAILRLQGGVSDQDSLEYRSSRTEEPFQELNRKSANLKRILSRIPDEITDRKTFLETIKEIASAIKKLLDAVNEVSAYIPGAQVGSGESRVGDSFVILLFSGQTFPGPEKERVCEVQQEVFQHTEGVFQGRPADHRVHFRHLLDPPDQHGDDHSEGQVRVGQKLIGEQQRL